VRGAVVDGEWRRVGHISGFGFFSDVVEVGLGIGRSWLCCLDREGAGESTALRSTAIGWFDGAFGEGFAKRSV
jgi:hypothetical protein